MEHSVCLNCNEPIDRKYCSNCGQKTDTHRISMKHFIFHDIIHGVYHLDKGIIYTIKQALVRPGEAAIDYINGKRVRFYNVFYLTLLLLAAGLFIDVLYSNALSNFPTYSTPVVETEESSKTFDLLGKYLKFLILLAVPFLAFNSFILFGKSKLD